MEVPVREQKFQQTPWSIKKYKRLIFKIFLLVFCSVLKTNIPYMFLGLINRVFPIFESIFICYAGNNNYFRAYGFKFSESWFLWSPSPIGIFKQGHNWGIVFASPMTETHFTADENRQNFNALIARFHRIAKYLGIKKVNYAGILPSYLIKNNMLESNKHNEMPGFIVFAAYKQLSIAKFEKLVPVILLGGAGCVGRYVQSHLKKADVDYYVVDPATKKTSLPSHYRGEPAIVIDTARKGVLESYIDQFWQELVVLNETFPEPSKKIQKLFKNRGNALFHLSGVQGKCYPSLPYGYHDSVPCCAIHSEATECIPVVRELNG